MDPHDGSDSFAPTRRLPVESDSQMATMAGDRGFAAGGQPRFLPGAVLGNRYQIVALLGRGGMGEVYRADDLKLGQKVALKFLPGGTLIDSETVAQLITEVRIGRQVSHPNVCRLYDFVEIDGHQFLSMELVEGENLASVLQSRGALPEGLVMRFAHDVCAGLAAAHAKGVLHRDLKPANVLINGNGQALISDFGLATLWQEKKATSSGTPAYMAPEQLRGEPATPQSDLFSLGVMLFELLTGELPYRATGSAGMLQERMEAPPRLSQWLQGVDPRVERLVHQCLDPDPARRPESAAWLGEQFPGEDPLHAALAMGMTPTRAMVAAARGSGMSTRAAMLVLLSMLAGIALLFVSAETSTLHRRLTIKGPEELRAAAIRLARAAGVEPARRYSASWYNAVRPELRLAMQEGRLSRLGSDIPSPVRFIHRGSAEPLAPRFPSATDSPPLVTESEPPVSDPGSVTVILDAAGHLTDLEAMPEPAAASPDADRWQPLLQASGLETATLKESAPRRTHAVAHDTSRAWSAATRSGMAVRIEGASLRGIPVSYHVTPLSLDGRAGAGLRPASGVLVALVLVFLGGSVYLTWRNLRVGRGDLVGAFRIAVTVFAAWVSWWLLGSATTGALFSWYSVSQMLWQGLYWAFLVWLGYAGLEPFVRRRWPQTLVGWTRLFDGRWLDPLVGRDLLIGSAAGVALELVRHTRTQLPPLLGLGEAIPFEGASDQLGGAMAMLQETASRLFSAFADSLGSLLIFLVLRVVTRRTWIAAVLWIAVMTTLNYSPRANVWIVIATTAAFVTIMLVVMIRWGLLALTTALFTTIILQLVPMSLDPSVPYFSATVTGMLVVAVLPLCGFLAVARVARRF